jgi:hypothetical protein
MLTAALRVQQAPPRYDAGRPRLLEQVRDVIRPKHYSRLRTEVMKSLLDRE